MSFTTTSTEIYVGMMLKNMIGGKMSRERFCAGIGCIRKVFEPHIYCDKHVDESSIPDAIKPFRRSYDYKKGYQAGYKAGLKRGKTKAESKDIGTRNISDELDEIDLDAFWYAGVYANVDEDTRYEEEKARVEQAILKRIERERIEARTYEEILTLKWVLYQLSFDGSGQDVEYIENRLAKLQSQRKDK